MTDLGAPLAVWDTSYCVARRCGALRDAIPLAIRSSEATVLTGAQSLKPHHWQHP
jgi:hypothetical protein